MKTVYIQCDDIDVTVESEYLEEAYESGWVFFNLIMRVFLSTIFVTATTCTFKIKPVIILIGFTITLSFFFNPVCIFIL